ncbi:MAG: adenosylcobalamin-dependent ribonucleoside-diphosphate reductase [Candidatus Neomarinimicrobiota bacterium]|nr:adenosylcobalamin-dependent ribonucleoside-diphosphate reductase [Candidatus Neomarinimicrobiota bacterium]
MLEKPIKDMFNHKGKTVNIIGKSRIKSYQELYDYIEDLQRNKEVDTHTNYLGDNVLARNIYEKKYFLKDIDANLIESCPEDVFKRLSSFLATVEGTKAKQKKWAQKYYEQLFEGYFIPGGRVMAGAGDLYRLKTLANCFVTKIEQDDINSIYKAAYECARTYSYGGGIGVDISSLRPKDSVVHNAADSSTGAVSFMELYSLTTGLIGQSGRRGALMLTIDVKHPDIEHFLKVKKVPNWVTNQIVDQCSWSGLFEKNELETIKKQVMENTQVRFANISIKASDEFMHAVDEQRQFHNGEFLIYKKDKKSNLQNANQDFDKIHYSTNIPSKDINDYELLDSFATFARLKTWLERKYNINITKSAFSDILNRDVFGDYSIELNNENFDLAIRQSGDFMLYFSSNETGEIRKLIQARDIWDQFVEGNYKTAEPGLIFWSTMSKYSPSNYVDRPIICTNPCAEVPLEDGGACNLGSLNLSRFVDDGYENHAKINWDQLAESTAILVRFLDNVVTWNEDLNALEKQRIAASETRRLGIGIMGIADMLNQLGISYDCKEGIEIITKVMEFITNAAYQASASLAGEKGASPIFSEEEYMQCPFIEEALSHETQNLIRENGIRNIAIMSIAPTGSISNIVKGFEIDDSNYIGVSGGVEPIFALYYTRRTESFNKNEFYKVFHSTVQAYIDKMDLQDEVDNSEKVEDILPEYFSRTAHEINPDKRVVIQGKIQKYIDHSISSTINLPEDVQPEVISDIYLSAWQKKLKGVTIYRDGSRFPILSTDAGELTEFQKIKDKEFHITMNDNQITTANGEEIIKLPDGSLTTVYHYVKNSSVGIEEVLTNTKFEEIEA